VVKRDVKPPIIAEAPFPDSFIALGFAAPEGASPTRG
jgi:tRNA pseudouridine32 synthase / 23S rRNA pseudouridine746 synthase